MSRCLPSLAASIGLSPFLDPLRTTASRFAPFDNKISHTVINEYLSHQELKKIQALILGCTHYPLIEAEVRQFYKSTNQNVFVVNSAKVVASEVQRILKTEKLLSKSLNNEHHFYVSDFTDSFEKSTKVFFGDELRLEKQNIWQL